MLYCGFTTDFKSKMATKNKVFKVSSIMFENMAGNEFSFRTICHLGFCLVLIIGQIVLFFTNDDIAFQCSITSDTPLWK